MYRVRDWNRHFEKAQSRGYERLSWVSVPNKHDGDGYTQLIEHEHGASHYGAWCVLVQVASRCKPRGMLVRENGQPHDPESLARQTRIGAHVFREAIPRFLEIGWLEETNATPLIAGQQFGMANVTERNVTEPNLTRSFVLASDQTDVWEAARQRAADIKRRLWPSQRAPLSERDRELLLKVAYLSRVILSEQWLSDGVEGTRLGNAKKPAAYLKTVLAETARRDGHNLNELLDAIEIPLKPAPAPGNKPGLGFQEVGKMPEKTT